MNAITIAPVTAACIISEGQDILNRSHSLPSSLLGKSIAIHTSTGFPEDVEDAYRNYGVRVEPVATNSIVAIVKLAGCPRRTDSRWAKPGLIHWSIELQAVLKKPLAYPGSSGIWDLDRDIHKHIYSQIEVKKSRNRKAPKILASVSA